MTPSARHARPAGPRPRGRAADRASKSSPALTAWLLVVLGVCGANGCARAAAPAPAVPTPPDLHATLRIGESLTATAFGAVITVMDVSDDSRCPVDATCVWAGDATVTVRVQPQGGTDDVVALHTGRPEAQSAVAAGLRLRLERLEPAPVSGQSIARDQYRVAIAVSR